MGLRYIDLPFNMSEPSYVTTYWSKWDKALAALGPCVFELISRIAC